MKIIFVALIVSALTSLISHAGSLEGPLHLIAKDISNRELVAQEAAKAESTMQPDTLVKETLDFLFASNDAASEAAAVRFLLALERFPFDVLASRFDKATSSTERANVLQLLNLGAREQAHIETVKRLAASVLYDQGTGLRRYGEARAYSPEGKRVCDVAYNILVSRSGLEATYPLLDVDNYGAMERDQMIEKLGIQLKIPNPTTLDAPRQKNSDSVTAGHLPINSSTPKEQASKSTTLGDELKSQTLWSVAVALIGTVIGLVWLLLKKRK